jgi:hypothetical protein
VALLGDPAGRAITGEEMLTTLLARGSHPASLALEPVDHPPQTPQVDVIVVGLEIKDSSCILQKLQLAPHNDILQTFVL